MHKMLLVWPCSREGSNKWQLVRQFDDEEEEEDDDSDGRTTKNTLGGSSGNFIPFAENLASSRAAACARSLFGGLGAKRTI